MEGELRSTLAGGAYKADLKKIVTGGLCISSEAEIDKRKAEPKMNKTDKFEQFRANPENKRWFQQNTFKQLGPRL